MQKAQKPRIGFIVPVLGGIGGSVRVAINIANRLVEHYDIVMYSCAPFTDTAFVIDDRIERRALDTQGARLRERVARVENELTTLLKQDNVQLLFGIGTYETLMALKPCKKAKVKLVFCDHGALINQWDDKQMRMIRLLSALFSDRTVVLTQQSYDDYRRLLHIPRKKLQRIPNWIPNVMRETPTSYRADSKRILWAGRLDKEKGVDHLLRIAALVLPKFPDWHWDVYGEQVLADKDGIDVQKEIENAGIQEQFHLMGRADNMYELYDNYAVVTLTSYREGLPLVLLEGKARALPLISFDVNTGPRDIIADGQDGFLVTCYDCEEYAEKLGRMLADQELRIRMSAAAEENVEAYSEEAVLSMWMNLLHELGVR